MIHERSALLTRLDALTGAMELRELNSRWGHLLAEAELDKEDVLREVAKGKF